MAANTAPARQGTAGATPVSSYFAVCSLVPDRNGPSGLMGWPARVSLKLAAPLAVEHH